MNVLKAVEPVSPSFESSPLSQSTNQFLLLVNGYVKPLPLLYSSVMSLWLNTLPFHMLTSSILPLKYGALPAGLWLPINPSAAFELFRAVTFLAVDRLL